MSEQKFVSRENFEIWVELQNAKVWVTPDWRSSKISVTGNFSNGVEWTLNATGILARTDGTGAKYFARGDEYNQVRVFGYQGSVFNFKGSGARSSETYIEAQKILDELTACAF